MATQRPMTNERIEAIRARRALITGVRWYQPDRHFVMAYLDELGEASAEICQCDASYNARFIASAPDDIDYLLKVIDELTNGGAS
jgi:hypothetical protein